jgi:EmrB/QacA subfamily drug resistance transporter
VYTLTKRERTFTLAGLLVALFLGALDQTIVATALPKILQDLKGLHLYSWVVTAYLLASTAMIPIYGKLSDLYGRKRIVLFGIAVFLLGSVLSGQSQSMVELIAFRALQGLGSAAIFSITFTVVADIFSPAERGKYQGLFGAVFGLASIAGPWLGGFLTDALSWRLIFYINLPLGLIAVIFIITQMPSLRAEVKRKVRIDWWGSIALVAGVIPILLALSLAGTEFAWGSGEIISLFAVGAGMLALFILIESKAKEPILPFDLFRNRTYVTGNIASTLVGGVGFFGAIIFLPAFMVLVVGASASNAGLTITPLVLGQVAGSFISGQLVSRLKRYKLVLLGGIALVFIGYLLMHAITAATTQADMTWRMIILGFGLGPALPVFTLAVQNSVAPREMGAATSSSIFFRQLGTVIGLAIFGTLLTTTLMTQLPVHLPAEMRELAGSSLRLDMGQLQSGDISAVERQIKTDTDTVYSQIELAVVNNDLAALKAVLANPLLPAELKDALARAGSPETGNYNGSTADPAANAAANGKNTSALLSRIKLKLDERATLLTGEATAAFRDAFADAVTTIYFWGIFVVVLGFIVALFMPELALRTEANIRSAGAVGKPEGEGNQKTDTDSHH